MRVARLAAVGAAAMGLAGVLPSVAGAADYCVAPNTNCDQNIVATLEDALSAAKATDAADRVFLSEGTYVAQSATGFDYDSADRPVEIIGAGRGRTILTAPAGATHEVLFLSGPPGTSVHDLTIRIPPQVAPGFSGLDTRALARRIDIVENPDQNPANLRYGARFFSTGALEDSSVTVGSGGFGVWFDHAAGSGTIVVRHSEITGETGVHSQGGGTIERSSLKANAPAVLADGGVTEVANSVLRFAHSHGAGIYANAVSPATLVKVDGATIIGPSGAADTGIYASTYANPTASVHVDVANSIVRARRPLGAYAQGMGQAEISASYSDYDPSSTFRDGTGKIAESNILNVGDPGFVDAASRDYHLLPGSPLIDAGDPDTPQGVDLDASPLVSDGNGDGSARRDLGAFELQPAPAPAAATQPTGPTPDTVAPLVTGFRAAKSLVRVGRGTRFRYTLSEDARVALRFQRIGRRSAVGTLRRSAVRGPNRIRFTGRIGRRALRPGRYRVVITATDAAGNRSVPRVARFRVVR